jgi:hypothetical protein
MGRPHKIRVGPVDWRVRWSRKAVRAIHPDGSASGGTDSESATIAIDPGKSEGYNRTVLIHEILHACLQTADINLSDKVEENVVRALTPTLLSTLRDNPRLVGYLTAP